MREFIFILYLVLVSPIVCVADSLMHECPAAPTFVILGGSANSRNEFDNHVQVRAVSATPGAVVHYTIDGSDPTTSSPSFGWGEDIRSTTVIRAVAVKDGVSSTIVTAKYTKVQPISQIYHIGFAPISTTWVDATWTAVPNAVEYELIIDGGMPLLVLGNSYRLTGLAPNTSYSVTMRALADEANTHYRHSVMSKAFTFKTLEEVKYTITFDGRGGVSSQPTWTQHGVGAGFWLNHVTATLPSACGRQGWSFAGWSTAVVTATTEVDDVELLPNTKYTPESDITLYAVYKQVVAGKVTMYTSNPPCGSAVAYTVMFDSGSGKCSVASLTESLGGQGVVLPEASAAGAGYAGWSFVGWSVENVLSETQQEPTLLAEGVTYYPSIDEILYAVYAKESDGVRVYSSWPIALIEVSGRVDATTLPAGSDVLVHPTGVLVVPADEIADLGVITIRTVGDTQAGQIELYGTLGADVELRVTRKISNDRYYFLSLPFDSDLADVRLLDGSSPGTYGRDWGVVRYDGYDRARDWEAVTDGTECSWEMIGANYTLDAMTGYNVAVGSSSEVELVFTMSTRESLVFDRKVAVRHHNDEASGTPPTDQGWNLIGHSLLSHYNGSLNTDLGEGVPYVSIFNGTTYKQVVATRATLLPFMSFFVQVGSDADVSFLSLQKKQRAVEPMCIVIDINSQNENEGDETTLLLDDTYSLDYEIGADLEKMITFGQYPQVYTQVYDRRRAFNAIPLCELGNVMLGYFAPAAGEYVLSLGAESSECEHVYLTDYAQGVTHDLALGEYVFAVDKREEVKDRFGLAIQKITVELNDALQEGWQVITADGVLRVIGVASDERVQVYDVTGRMVRSELSGGVELMISELPTGVYVVQTMGASRVVVHQ